MYRLYLLFLPDCPTCKATKPEVAAWMAAHPWIKLVEADLTDLEWGMDDWEPRVAPTLVLLEPRGVRHVREHGANRRMIEEWVRKVCPAALVRPRASESVVEPPKTPEAK